MKQITFVKILIIILAALILFNCSSDKEIGKINPNSEPYKKIQISQEDKEFDKINELKVSSRRTYSKFTTKYVKSGGRELLVELINFDTKGKRTEQFRYISNGDVDLQWIFDYNFYGQPTLIETYDGYQQLISKEINTYNSDGYKEKSETWSDKTKAYSTIEYDYDSENNLIEEISRNPKSEIINTKEYVYTNSRRDTLKLFSSKKELVYKIIFEHESDSILTREKQIDVRGKLYTTDFKYDDAGNIISIDNSVLSDWFYEYDNKGNILTEIQNNSEGFLQTKFEYKYDSKNGLLIEKIRYDGENDPAVLIRYEYDFY